MVRERSTVQSCPAAPLPNVQDHRFVPLFDERSTFRHQAEQSTNAYQGVSQIWHSLFSSRAHRQSLCAAVQSCGKNFECCRSHSRGALPYIPPVSVYIDGTPTRFLHVNPHEEAAHKDKNQSFSSVNKCCVSFLSDNNFNLLLYSSYFPQIYRCKSNITWQIFEFYLSAQQFSTLNVRSDPGCQSRSFSARPRDSNND